MDTILKNCIFSGSRFSGINAELAGMESESEAAHAALAAKSTLNLKPQTLNLKP